MKLLKHLILALGLAAAASATVAAATPDSGHAGDDCCPCCPLCTSLHGD
jgi:hypothetical protein